jgi:hypothetical protein
MQSYAPEIIDVGDVATNRSLTLRSAGSDVARFDNAGRMDPAVQAYVADEFLRNKITSGDIGDLGWSTFGTSPTIARVNAVSSRPGIVSVSTPAASGAVGIVLGDTADPSITPADNFDITFIVRCTTLVSGGSTDLFGFGLANGTPSSITIANGILFVKGASGTQWNGRTVSSSTITTVGAMGAVDTNWHQFRIRRKNGTTIEFIVDNTTIGTSSTNVPTVAMNPVIIVQTTNTTVHTVQADYFDLVMRTSR